MNEELAYKNTVECITGIVSKTISTKVPESCLHLVLRSAFIPLAAYNLLFWHLLVFSWCNVTGDASCLQLIVSGGEKGF